MVAVEPTISLTPRISELEADRYADLDPDWGFGGLGYVTYKRTYARPIFAADGDTVLRTEEWHETVLRAVNGAQEIGADLTLEELRRLYDYIFYLKGSVSGRALWQLGTPNVAKIGADALVNCWMVDVGHVSDFAWTIERLMLGGGVGFSVDKPERLGVTRSATVTHHDADDADFIVPDKREGWGEMIERLMLAYFGGPDDPSEFTYATHLLRPEGTPIKGFGGTASGPDPLIEGVEGISKVLDNAVNRTLTSVDLLDIMTILGSVVVAGNVRRSAMIALGNVWDRDYFEAKRWDLDHVIPDNRRQSNNSVYVNSEQMRNMPDHVWEGYHGNGEPYGFFNLEASQEFGRMGELRPDYTIVGVNPCGEIPLAHRGSCNLAEINLPRISSSDEFQDLSVLLYKVQKAIASLPCLDRVSTSVIQRDMRLGLTVTGIAQALPKIDWLDAAYTNLRAVDVEWSAKKGLPVSTRLTGIQPSGTKSFLFGSTPGIHPGFSKYYVKGMRMGANDVLVDYCAKRGYSVEPLLKIDGTPDARTVVVDFPCEFPDSTVFASEMTAITQMDLVRKLQRVWADNAISVTVYYRDEELPGIQKYLAEHWHEMKSVSFLRHEEHGFAQAPMREITEAEYVSMINSVQGIGDKIGESTYTSYLDDGCDTGSCPVR